MQVGAQDGDANMRDTAAHEDVNRLTHREVDIAPRMALRRGDSWAPAKRDASGSFETPRVIAMTVTTRDIARAKVPNPLAELSCATSPVSAKFVPLDTA